MDFAHPWCAVAKVLRGVWQLVQSFASPPEHMLGGALVRQRAQAPRPRGRA